MSIEKTLAVFARGSDEIIPLDELKTKLKKAKLKNTKPTNSHFMFAGKVTIDKNLLSKRASFGSISYFKTEFKNQTAITIKAMVNSLGKIFFFEEYIIQSEIK